MISLIMPMMTYQKESGVLLKTPLVQFLILEANFGQGLIASTKATQIFTETFTSEPAAKLSICLLCFD